MKMRRDEQRSSADPEAGKRFEWAKNNERPGGWTPSVARVELSSELFLVETAVTAARDAPSTRSEAVDRGRRALEGRTLGADSDRLAERILATLLGE
ncbi:MAG: flagellar biosynthesis anti-sigma factor FlgM [Acidobacteriota bacterium]